jgi:hypothetical protein
MLLSYHNRDMVAYINLRVFKAINPPPNGVGLSPPIVPIYQGGDKPALLRVNPAQLRNKGELMTWLPGSAQGPIHLT